MFLGFFYLRLQEVFFIIIGPFLCWAGLAGNVLWVLGARGSINKPICPGQGIYIKNRGNNRLKRSAATTLVLLHMRMILVTLMYGI